MVDKNTEQNIDKTEDESALVVQSIDAEAIEEDDGSFIKEYIARDENDEPLRFDWCDCIREFNPPFVEANDEVNKAFQRCCVEKLIEEWNTVIRHLKPDTQKRQNTFESDFGFVLEKYKDDEEWTDMLKKFPTIWVDGWMVFGDGQMAYNLKCHEIGKYEEYLFNPYESNCLAILWGHITVSKEKIWTLQCIKAFFSALQIALQRKKYYEENKKPTIGADVDVHLPDTFSIKGWSEFTSYQKIIEELATAKEEVYDCLINHYKALLPHELHSTLLEDIKNKKNQLENNQAKDSSTYNNCTIYQSGATHDDKSRHFGITESKQIGNE